MDKINNEKVKKDVGKIAGWIFDRLTPNAARLCSLLVILLVLVLGLATQTGRNVISFIAYVVFGLQVLYWGIKFYKYCYTHANREPKRKEEAEPAIEPQEVKAESDSEPQEVNTEMATEPVVDKPPRVIYGTISEWGKEDKPDRSKTPNSDSISEGELPKEESK